MEEYLRKVVCKVNRSLIESRLVELTFGNASAFDKESGLVAIKPSGVDFKELYPGDIVFTNLEGEIVKGDLKPSSDLLTHLEIYRNFPGVGGVVHTHSTNASSFAQARVPLACYGTTHADHFYGSVPTTSLEDLEIQKDYELNTGKAIVKYFKKNKIGPLKIPACLVQSHGPFVWGKDLETAFENAVALEKSAEMAIKTLIINPNTLPIDQVLLDKHFLRKHGKNAYYGQK